MSKPQQTYSLAEKARLMAEVERRYHQGDRSYQSITDELGIPRSSYHNWVRAGVKSAVLTERQPIKFKGIYKAAERERFLVEIERLRGQGQSIQSACRQAGISQTSYDSWRKLTSAAPMRPVEVTALVPAMAMPKSEPVLEKLTLISPGGYSVEGLGLESMATLLRALA